jgi:cysteine desulfurase
MVENIYLDAGATTEVDPKVIEAMQPYITEKYGNASSSHDKGKEAKQALENARKIIAKAIDAKPKEIVFTSGGTEANNFAIKSIAFTNKDRGNHIITTKIEHDCILESCKWLEKQGFKITYLDVDEQGFVKPEVLESAITDKTILVSIIHGNNEIGTIQDLETLGNVCKKHGVYFHTDACQSFTKTEVNSKYVDLITLNAHKIHGPKGVGCLFIKKGTKIEAWQHGGGHELGFRSGTENIPAIIGFAKAVQLATKNHVAYMTKLRDKLISSIKGKLHGPAEDKRLCNNVNVYFENVDGDALGSYLNNEKISSSLGSACSTNNSGPSHVLKALGLSDKEASNSVRLTISRFTKEEDIDRVIFVLEKAVKKLGKRSFIDKLIDKF